MKSIVAFILAVAVFSGCDSSGPGSFTPQVSVSALLVANDFLPPVRLALTGPIGDLYDPVAQSINDAAVQLQWIRSDGSILELPYVLSEEELGIYEYANPEEGLRVEGGGTYRFEALVPGFADSVRAETIVPDSFSIARPLPDTVFYQVGPSPRMDLTPTFYPGRQNVYVFNVRALDPENFPLTPFAAELVNDRDVDPVDLYEGTSPLLNEGNYQINPDGTVGLGIVWLAFNFYGPQRILVTAVDDALIDFIQSQVIQFLPTTLSPGEIPNVISNVQNGVGVFGAVAQVTATTFVAPAP